MAFAVNINFSDAEEKAITRAVAIVNQGRAAQNQAPITNANYVRGFINNHVQMLIAEYRAGKDTSLRDAYSNATPEVQTQIQQLLGVDLS